MDHVAAVVRRAAALTAFLFSGASHAGITLSQFPPNPGVMPGGGWQWQSGSTFANPTPPRAWVNGVYGSVPKIVATDAMTLAAKGGPMAVSVAQRVGLAEAGAAIGRCMAGSVPVCAAATAAAIAYEVYRIHAADDYPGTPCASGELCFDPGTPPQQAQGFEYRAYGDGWGTRPAQPTWAASVSEFVSYCTSGGPATCSASGVTVNPDTYAGGAYITRTRNSDGAVIGYFVISSPRYDGPMVQSCPASVDASNPAYSVPAGMPPGVDGKCPTARYNHQPITPENAGAKIAAYPPGDFSTNPLGIGLRDALKDAIESGQQVPAEVESTGPASQTGQPTTTTTTNGQGTTTTTKQETYNYNYAGDKITYQTVTNTYTCTGAGSCSSANADSTTTTTTEPPPEGSTEQEGECAKNPTAAGCVKLGTPPDAEAMPGKSIAVTVAPESGFGADTGTCPAMVQTQLIGSVDPFGLVCTYMSGIRFAVIGIAWIMAALIFLGRVD
jgi:hypothetical protein